MSDAENPVWLQLLRVGRHLAGQPPLRELGKRAGLSASTLSDILSGKAFPRSDNFYALLDAIKPDDDIRDRAAAAYEDEVADRARNRRTRSGDEPSADAVLIAAAIDNVAQALSDIAVVIHSFASTRKSTEVSDE